MKIFCGCADSKTWPYRCARSLRRLPHLLVLAAHRLCWLSEIDPIRFQDLNSRALRRADLSSIILFTLYKSCCFLGCVCQVTDSLSIAGEMPFKTQMRVTGTDSISYVKRSSNERVYVTKFCCLSNRFLLIPLHTNVAFRLHLSTHHINYTAPLALH